MKKISTLLATAIFNFAFVILNSPQAHAQIITTFAGNGTAGYAGNGGQATAAELRTPACVAFDASGNMYIADANNNRIRMVNTAGIISTFSGIGTAGYTGDGGQATAAELHYPDGVAVDASGNVYIADASNNRIRTVSTAGIISTFAGNGTAGYTGDGGQATAATLNSPAGLALGASGNVYIADANNNAIRKISTAGIISTIAGGGSCGGSYCGDGGQATAAQLNSPNGVAVDAAGNVYIVDYGNNRIRIVSTVGIISTFAGNGTAAYSGDGGQATTAELSLPFGVAFDAVGNVYIADYYNNRIRQVNTAGIISTFAGNGFGAGTGTGGYSGDGGVVTAAELYWPYGVAFDATGNVYIVDGGNSVIRKVCVSICTSAGIEQYAGISNQLSVYPNPTNSILNVAIDPSLTPPQGERTITVTDVLGNVLIHNSEIVNQKCTLDVSGLPAGVYFVRVGTATQKFIKQ